MSFARTVSQQRALPGIFQRRCASTTSTKPKAEHLLPDAKLRALISLYHQTETFITRENLTARIDDAFVPKSIAELDTGIRSHEVTLDDLQDIVKKQAAAPKYVGLEAVDVAFPTSTEESWRDNKSRLHLKVQGALYGVDVHSGGARKPDLEVLREEIENESRHKPE